MASKQLSQNSTPAAAQPWLHRLAWVQAILIFPLVWMGGLVTTYNAGMAVPDWPNTYGYLFLYPIESWLETWDVFLEHSHRLIGAAVGLVAIALVVVAYRSEQRRLRWLAVTALVAVSLQGVLGGIRVLGQEMLIASLHGCTAPLVFSYCGWLVIFTSQRWREHRAETDPSSPPGRGMAIGLVVLVYLQIVLGAQLRHLYPTLAVYWGTLWVWLHVGLGLALLLGWLALRWRAAAAFRNERFLLRRANWFLGLYLVQLALGAGTWVTNYNWPRWFRDYFIPISYTVTDGGILQATITTAHVAVGSLLLVVAVSLVAWIWPRRGAPRPAQAGRI